MKKIILSGLITLLLVSNISLVSAATTEWYSLNNAEYLNDKVNFSWGIQDSYLSADGKKLWILNTSSKIVTWYNLSSAFDISTKILNWDNLQLNSDTRFFVLNTNGSILYSSNGSQVYTYELVSNYTVNWGVYKWRFTVSKHSSESIRDIKYYNWRMFILLDDEIEEYIINSPTSASLISNKKLDSLMYAFAIVDWWKKLITGKNTYIYSHISNTPYKLNNYFITKEILSTEEYIWNYTDFYFSNDGKKMFIVSANDIFTFSSSIPSDMKENKYASWDLFSEYENWNKSKLINKADDTFYYLKLLWASVNQPSTHIDINGDGLIDMIYINDFTYKIKDYSNIIKSKTWKIYTILLNNWDNTFQPSYKCIYKNYYYYGDCAQ